METAERPPALDQSPEPEEEPDQPAALARPPILRPLPPPAGDGVVSSAQPNHLGSDRLFTRPFVGLLGMQAAYGFSISMFFLLPKYLAAAGEAPSRIGLVMGGFGVACIATIPLLPLIIKVLGRRRALMAATLLLAAAGAMFALLTRPGWAAVILRASEGVTWTIMFSTALSLTAEMAPRGRLAQAIGLAGGASLVMNAVAPAIGEPLSDRFGYRPVFALAALAAVVAALLARRLPVAAQAPVHPTAPSSTSKGPSADSASRFALYWVFGLGGLGYGVLFTFLAPFALLSGVHAIRAFFVAYTCSALAVRIAGGRLTDQVGHAPVAMGALALYGGVIASTGVVGAHHLALLGLVFGLAHGAAFPAMMALLISHAPPSIRPRTLAVANGAMSLGISAVFPVGILAKAMGYPAVFGLAGILTAASAGLIWSMSKRTSVA